MAGRPGGSTARGRADLHVALDDALRRVAVPPPHTIAILDTGQGSPAAATAWSATCATVTDPR